MIKHNCRSGAGSKRCFQYPFPSDGTPDRCSNTVFSTPLSEWGAQNVSLHTLNCLSGASSKFCFQHPFPSDRNPERCSNTVFSTPLSKWGAQNVSLHTIACPEQVPNLFSASLSLRSNARTMFKHCFQHGVLKTCLCTQSPVRSGFRTLFSTPLSLRGVLNRSSLFVQGVLKLSTPVPSRARVETLFSTPLSLSGVLETWICVAYCATHDVVSSSPLSESGA